MPETVTLAGDPPLTPRWEPWMRALLADPPEWLVRERETHREVVAEQERLREQRDR